MCINSLKSPEQALQLHLSMHSQDAIFFSSEQLHATLIFLDCQLHFILPQAKIKDGQLLGWHRLVNSEFFWAPDESFIALKCTPFDGDVESLELVDMTHSNDAVWNILYVIDVAMQAVHHLTQMPDYSDWGKVMSLGALMISDDSRCGHALSTVHHNCKCQPCISYKPDCSSGKQATF